MEAEVTVTINHVQYFLIESPENFLPDVKLKGSDPLLVTVIPTTAGQVVSRDTLADFRSQTLDQDDVFQQDFLRNVVFYGSKIDELDVRPDAFDQLAEWQTQTYVFTKDDHGPAGVKPGPYVLSKGHTWQPWRVYHDFNTCFMTSFKPSKSLAKTDWSFTLEVLDIPIGGTAGRVIVPSRCYFSPSESRPLDGARISVKDNIDVAGHRTTLCNRAWMDLYPAKTAHAACVQAVLDAGAVVVGKVKLQAMIMREEPLEAVEFTAPFNPRADGYQVPSGSSHASAAGISSYDWLDFSFGSDTNGSGRKPASYNGCFSIRPSTGIVDTSGVVGQFDLFDMPVFFGRDLARFPQFMKTWYRSSADLRAPSKKIRVLWPTDYLPTTNKAQSRLLEDFTRGLEGALQVEREEINLSANWKQDLPDGEENEDLAAYLELTGAYPYYHDSYHNLEDFRQNYHKEHGKPPFVQRAMLWQWDVSKKITREERDYYWRRSEIYRHWLLSRIFKADDQETLSVMVFPIELGQPNYRDSVPPPFGILSGYSPLNMSPMMRAPELTSPLGSIPYDSIVTKRTEQLPIAVSVIGPPGSDHELPTLVKKALTKAGIPVVVKTGSLLH